MALLGELGQIASVERFQRRVWEAMATAAAAVYSEGGFAQVSQATSINGKVLTFSGGVPSWVIPGGTVSDLTSPASIQGIMIAAVTATTVTLAQGVSGSVGGSDVILFNQHTLRAGFASRLLSNPNFNILPYCYAVLVNPTIEAEANINTVPDYNIPDADIQFAVNSMWNLFAGA